LISSNMFSNMFSKHVLRPSLVSSLVRHLATGKGLKGLMNRKVTPWKKWPIVVGDQVEVVNGPDKKKRGQVLRVYRAKNLVLVEGVNLKQVSRHPTFVKKGSNEKVSHPVDFADVSLIDPKTDEPTKIRTRRNKEGKKVRLSKSGATIDKPPKKVKQPTFNPLTDTPAELVQQQTYVAPVYELIDGKTRLQKTTGEQERDHRLAEERHNKRQRMLRIVQAQFNNQMKQKEKQKQVLLEQQQKLASFVVTGHLLSERVDKKASGAL